MCVQMSVRVSYLTYVINRITKKSNLSKIKFYQVYNKCEVLTLLNSCVPANKNIEWFCTMWPW